MFKKVFSTIEWAITAMVWGILSLVWRILLAGFGILSAIFSRPLGLVMEHHAGAFFSLLAFLLSAWLFSFGFLQSFDDYLQAMIYQRGYLPTAPLKQFLIVKKDEKTSSLLGENPGRDEFGAIFDLMGKPQQFVVSMAGKKHGRGYHCGTLQFGLCGSNPFSSSLFSGEAQITGASESQWLFSVAETLAVVPRFLRFPKLPPEFVPGTNLPPATLAPVQTKFGEFFKNLVQSVPSLTFKAFPEPGIALQILFWVNIDENVYFTIPHAGIIGLDFILQGQKVEVEDGYLIDAIAQSECPVILGGQLLRERIQKEARVFNASGSSAVGSEEFVDHIVEVLPQSQFQQKNTRVGYVNAAPDNKGYLTRMPMFVFHPYQKTLKPTFSLLIAAIYLDQQSRSPEARVYQKAMEAEFQRILPQIIDGTYQGGFTLHDRVLPVDERGNLYVYFLGSVKPFQRKEGSRPVFPSASFYECFHPKHLEKLLERMPEKPPELFPEKAHINTCNVQNNFGGKIVLAGPFERSDFDFYPTPMTLGSPFQVQNDMLMGIEIHANALANILEERYLRPPKGNHTLFLLLTGTLLLGMFLDRMRPTLGGFMVLLFMYGVMRLSSHAYNVQQQIFYFSPFLFSFPVTWAMTTMVNYIRQQQKASATKALFQRFVSPDVVQFLIDHPDEVRPGGQKVEMTIFFSDLAGFTTISESLTPEDLVILMNEYLGAMTELLFKHGGTLDKYIGDAVMAYWNFPQRQEDHAVRACLYTIEMHQKLAELQADWKSRGLPKAYARAGMNTAKVVVGCMGSEKAQMNFTCLGDGVNLASRLEGANKEYGTLYMVSDATYQQAKHRIRGRFLDFLAVKGKKEPVKTHELICEIGKEPPGLLEKIGLYDKGINLHLERHWDEAIASFEELLSRWPDDGPSQTYLKRCHEYKENPPPENWDGSYHLTHK